MRIINTCSKLLTCFSSGAFDLEKWENYMDECVPGAKALCLDDMQEVTLAGYSWEECFLPVLNAVFSDIESRELAISSFLAVTERLDTRLIERFGRSVEADLVLYLGLCSGAGWVTPVNGKTTVLFGIEKIMELGWGDLRAMTGLVMHELGHIYHHQYGQFEFSCEKTAESFLWQLFTEGVAMVFEQELCGDPESFHQYDWEWKAWCDQNLEHIKRSFAADLPTMTHENQRYFGDWVRFEGRGDTGYYLGARFVRFLMENDDFDSIIGYGIEKVKAGFESFLS